MGIYKQGILGPYSGRIGNLICSSWKGKAVLRTGSTSYTDANTIPQQTQRLKFSLVSSLMKAYEKMIRIGFAAADARLTAFNSALRANISAITGTFPSLSFNPEQLKLSAGNLLGLEGVKVTSDSNGIVKLDWVDNSNSEDAFIGDRLMVSLMDEATGEVVHSDNYTSRNEGTASIQLPATWKGRSVHVHAFFVKDVTRVTNRNHVSNSQYLGMVAVA